MNFLQRYRAYILIVAGILVLVAIAFAVWWKTVGSYSPTREQLTAFIQHPDQRAPLITEMHAPCPNAPFLLPSVGFVGLLYGDPSRPYTPFTLHPGVDIFGDGKPGTVAVVAAYDGYLTRLKDWKGSVIIRIPKDPLDPSRQIWTYYAHMASVDGNVSFISSEFPPGTSEKFVKQGTLLGYQGLYAGDAPSINMHVHFSVDLSNDDGSFRNETHIWNTLDPSPYFGMILDARNAPVIPVRCKTP